MRCWSCLLILVCLLNGIQTCCEGCCTQCSKCTTTQCKTDCCHKAPDCCQSCPSTRPDPEISSRPIPILPVIQPAQPSSHNISNNIHANVSVSNVINNQNLVNFSINVNSNNVNNINVGGCGSTCSNSTVLVPVPYPVTIPCEKCTTSLTPSTSPHTPPTPPTTTSTSPTTPTTPCTTTPTTPCTTTPTTTCPTSPTRPCTPTPTTPCTNTPQPCHTTCTPVTPNPWPRCCIIIVPCIIETCNPYHRVCGHHCHGNRGFVPRDPCDGGCQKRDHWRTTSCWLGQCRERAFDCSYCNDDSFYLDHDSYFKCRGCYYR